MNHGRGNFKSYPRRKGIFIQLVATRSTLTFLIFQGKIFRPKWRPVCRLFFFSNMGLFGINSLPGN
jgi:hypothetical protein